MPPTVTAKLPERHGQCRMRGRERLAVPEELAVVLAEVPQLDDAATVALGLVETTWMTITPVKQLGNSKFSFSENVTTSLPVGPPPPGASLTVRLTDREVLPLPFVVLVKTTISEKVPALSPLALPLIVTVTDVLAPAARVPLVVDRLFQNALLETVKLIVRSPVFVKV